jgi:hypothetical protein
MASQGDKSTGKDEGELLRSCCHQLVNNLLRVQTKYRYQIDGSHGTTLLRVFVVSYLKNEPSYEFIGEVILKIYIV